MGACVHDPELLLPDPGQTADSTDECHPDSVYFENDILPLLASNCAYSGCHDAASAQNGVILDTYANIINTGDVDPFDPEGSDLFDVITDPDPDDRMPPAGDSEPLSASQIQLIETWINQGALNNGCDGCGSGTAVTWSLTIAPLVETHCQGCHSGASPDAGIDLSTYDQVFGFADSGALMGVLNASAGFVPMPYESDPLTPCLIDQFQDWVDQGAPEN